MTTISKLFANGVLQTSVELDEVTYTSIKFNRNGVYSSQFDEVTINGQNVAERRTKIGRLLVAGELDEVTIKPSPIGEIIFDTPGTYTWICPAGVTSVCAVAVGAGGGGGTGGYSGYSAYSGGGGGLGWKNNIAVIPGNTYTVVVGAGGIAALPRVPPANMTPVQGGAGGDSYFINTSTVKGGGAPSGGNGGTHTGDGGGNGGNAGSSSGGWGGGAGGAGGYTGNGGNGGQGAQFTHPEDFGAGFNGQGGGGGGAGGTGSGNREIYGYGSAGGGVGLYGQGVNGLGGDRGWGNPGKGGSGGEDGQGAKASNGGSQHGGKYGGGGGNSGYGFYMPASAGSKGAVRIIWGAGRSFPLNAS
jgi:hypothetical protein